jgi:hypothetical protein
MLPADSENAWPWREREIHDRYALAEAVGAEVEFAPDGYRDGWKLTARWSVGAVPASAEVDVRDGALSVRPIEPAPGVHKSVHTSTVTPSAEKAMLAPSHPPTAAQGTDTKRRRSSDRKREGQPKPAGPHVVW